METIERRQEDVPRRDEKENARVAFKRTRERVCEKGGGLESVEDEGEGVTGFDGKEKEREGKSHEGQLEDAKGRVSRGMEWDKEGAAAPRAWDLPWG